MSERAKRSIKVGNLYPFDAPDEWDSDKPALPAVDWAHSAARGIIHDLSFRRGIKHGFVGIDEDIRENIVESLADIIREAKAQENADEGALDKQVSDLEYALRSILPLAWRDHRHPNEQSLLEDCDKLLAKIKRRAPQDDELADERERELEEEKARERELVNLARRAIENANGNYEMSDGERGWLIHDDHITNLRDALAKLTDDRD